MKCKSCKRELKPELFHWQNKSKEIRKNRCKQCINEIARVRAKKRYKEDPEKYRQSQKQTRINRRKRVIKHYGGKCECCDEDKYEFLSIDHIDGGGTQHRTKIGANIDRWLVKNNFPSGFRVLCHNCNFSLGMYGYCPHNE